MNLRWKRAVLASLCGITAAAALSVPALGARTVPVQVDGSALEGTAYLESGVTYVPLRSLLDAFGGWELSWDSKTRTAVADGADATLTADPAAGTVSLDAAVYAGKQTNRLCQFLSAGGAGKRRPIHPRGGLGRMGLLPPGPERGGVPPV